jgi:hypothetical protein
MLHIGFDIGGCLSKYLEIRTLFRILCKSDECKCFVISDMHPKQKILDNLLLNDINIPENQVYTADYGTHGENCKKVLCESLKIDIMIDDHMGYISEGDFVRLLVMPNPYKPYYHEKWKTDGSEGDFGRNKAAVKDN